MSEQQDDGAVSTIQLTGGTLHYMQGAAAGRRVIEAHEDTSFPDFQTRLNLFWFYAGALAAGEYKLRETDEFSMFLLGVKSVAPEPPEED